MASTGKRRLGDLGEAIALRYLVGIGYALVQKNYLKPQGEIDLTLKKDGILHFVEVKTVSWRADREEIGERGIRPEENLHKNKLKRLFRAVQIYLIEHRVPEAAQWQIDAVFVFIDQKYKKSKVEYYEHISLE